MRLYVDGQLVDSNESVSGTFPFENLYIGSHFTTQPVSFWDGYISTVTIYSSVKSDYQILSAFNQSKSNFGL